MPIHVLRIHKAIASSLLVLLAIAAFHATALAKPVASTGESASAVGGANTCTVTNCGQCGQTCTGGYDKNGSCVAWSCNTCTITSASVCPAACSVTSCAQCGQSCTGGYDKNGGCYAWSCNTCTAIDASCGRGCPLAIPSVVDAFDAQCLTRTPNTRCPSEISPTVCSVLITNSSRVGLLTADGGSWLLAHSFCPVLRPDGGALLGFCPMGCFAADTQILTRVADNGAPDYTAVGQVTAEGSVLAVSDEAGIDAVDLVSHSIERVVSGPETQPLVALTLSNGATLRVTSHHPMVLATGVIVEAAAVTRGAAFIGVDGQIVKVRSVKQVPATDDVFNFETNGTTQLSHVVVAEGVLIGDLKLQNELAVEQHSIDLRRTL